ncbi:NUDIX domain-containing protein [Paenibacillus sp. LMG 31460]|uniref:NUDIX domain-containing protein n=1 Tax=Paenibacillus germinis TaxID=2654979 RepID=A0ABX1Z5T8_9BACL|nr:NUDIX domain-containing protein [Paenibacillus germinis]NOU88199.1 NUDIX domain-containing protein [Paenibacillus germinis]
MQLIKRITDSDFLGGDPEFMDRISRYGSRGVLLDSMLNVAMMYMSKTNLYKLPGGGVDEGENTEDAFLREIKEETGYEAEIIHELGYIEEHKKINDFMQISYCYIAKAHNSVSDTMLSESEMQLGMVVKWMTLDKALEMINYSVLNNDDYSTKFMILRDKTILEKAVKILNGKVNGKKITKLTQNDSTNTGK